MPILTDPVNDVSQLVCANCIHYEVESVESKTICHNSAIVFNTQPDSWCTEGLFIIPFQDQPFLLPFVSAYSALINPDSVFSESSEEPS